MTETAVSSGVLTKDDVKALRTCDRVSLSHKGKASNGEGLIRCIKVLEKKGPFDDDERTHSIKCESRVRCYKSDDTAFDWNDEFSCHELLYN